MDDEDEDGSLDGTNRGSLMSSAMRGSIDTSFEVKDGVRARSTTAGVAHVTPKKPGGTTLTAAVHSHKGNQVSSYANDHSKLRILDAQPHGTFWPGGASDHQAPEYEVSLAITMIDSHLAEHTKSLWWLTYIVEHYGMFLRHAGFRGRGCHTVYVQEVIRGVHMAQGSLLSLELSDMWFFTVFLNTIATTTQELVELQHLSLEACHVFPTLDETVGELVTQLPSLQSITVHQFDFTVGRAKQILEASSEHPCLRHVNLNDNVLKVNAQGIVNSNVQSIRSLESFHMNHLPDDFWTFGDFFAYKTNLRVLQLSHVKLSETAVRDIGHCLNVALMLEELLLDHCGLQESSMELLFPCIRRGAGHPPGLFYTAGDSRGDSPLLMTQSSTSGVNQSFHAVHHDHFTPDDASRNSSPAPSAQAIHHQHSASAESVHQHPLAVGGGLGVNPYFAPMVASPLQLMPFSSPFSLSNGDGGETTPYRSVQHGSTRGGGGPSFGAHTICATLPHLRVLNLSNNPFGLNGLTQLATPLSRMQALEQLYLSGCGLHGDNTAESLFSTLDPICGGLFVLDLARNDLGDKTIAELCNMNFFAKLSSNVAEVFLGETGLSQTSIITLLKTFSEHAEWLSVLDLSVNGWATPQAQHQGRAVFHVDPMQPSSPTAPAKLEQDRIDGLVSLLGAAVVHDAPVPVTTLRLNFCAFTGDDWVESLRRISRMDAHHQPSPIKVLQLASLFAGSRGGSSGFAGNHDAADATPSVASTATTMSLLVHSISNVFGNTLTSLDLSRNPLGDDVVTELLVCHCGGGNERRGHCVSCQLCHLQTLQLRKVDFGALSLQSSELREEDDSDEPVSSLVALVELDLSGNRILLAGFEALARTVFRHLVHLQRLDLSQNYMFMPTTSIVAEYPLDADNDKVVGGDTPQEDPTNATHEGAEDVGKSDKATLERAGAPDGPEDATEPTAPSGSSGKKNKPGDAKRSRDPVLTRLRHRRAFIVGKFFESLIVATSRCRNTLRRLKLDANGLSHLHCTSTIRDMHAIPVSTECKALLGPLGMSDYEQLEALLNGARWYVHFLFSIHVSSS